MAEYRPVVITNEGQRVLFKAINGKYRLKFTSMAFGSGSYDSSDTGVNLTALKCEKQRVDIQKIKTQNDTTVIIQSNVSNKDITEGYYLTEVGIYVKNADDESSGETLYAVAIATVPDFMSNVSKIKIGSTSYDVADKTARDRISALSDNMNNMETTLLDEISSIYDEIPNVTKGSGTLTNGSDVSIRYSDYSYQKIDNIVTLEVHMYINPDRTIGNLIFDLPFRTTNQYNGVCISSINALYKWAIEDSTLTISKLDVQNEISKQWVHEKGEEFRFVITYEYI